MAGVFVGLQVDELDQAVADLLKRVGRDIVLPRFGALTEQDIQVKSSPTDLVTVADHEAEGWLTPRLQQLVDCVVIGEEACAATPELRSAVAEPRAWTVDPIDGTSNFVKGDPRFCSMVSLLTRGVPVASWIWIPLTGDLYSAFHGEGAFRRDADGVTQPLKAAGTVPSLQDMLGAGNALGIDEPKRTAVRAGLKALAGRSFPGSSGILGTDIARGEKHFMFHGKCTPWDHSPVDLLCREAGGHAAMVIDAAPFSADRAEPFLIAPTQDNWQALRSHIWLEG